MITSPTVLILGAGASAHVGYPSSGLHLISSLCELRGTTALKNLPMGWTSTDANEFLTRLSQAAYYSVDAFLEKNTEQEALGKYLIALRLKHHEIMRSLFPPNCTDSWYQYLLNVLVADDGTPRIQADHLGIVTFNYARSLEAYLHWALQSRFSLSSEQAATVLSDLPIVHVYGILGSYPDVPYEVSDDPENLLEISQQIQIIHQGEDVGTGFCNKMFAQANDMLNEAKRIFFLGFGFYTDNVRRFNFFTPKSMADREVRGTTTRMGRADRKELGKRMEVYGLSKVALVDPTSHTCNGFFKYVESLE